MAQRSDDFFVPVPFVPKAQEPDFRNSFWSELPDMRPNRGPDKMATVNMCRHDSSGRHETPIPSWCPHFERQDETGFRIRPDWTVQDDAWYYRLHEES